MPESVIEDHVSVHPNVEDCHVELWVKGKHVKLTVADARTLARLVLEVAETVAGAKDAKTAVLAGLSNSEPASVPEEPQATQAEVDHHSV